MAFLPSVCERIPEADRRRRLALTGRRGRHRGNQDQLAILGLARRINEICADFRFVMTVGDERIDRDSELPGDFLYWPDVGGLGNFDVTFYSHGLSFQLHEFKWLKSYSKRPIGARPRGRGLSLPGDPAGVVIPGSRTC